jgi:heme exporter protein D
MEFLDTKEPPNFRNRVIITVEKVALKSLATGNFAWFVLLAIALGCIWKLGSKDLKEVLLTVLATYGWLGYGVGGITIFVCIRVLQWRERFYQQEMTRIAELRNQLMQGKLELPLKSSVELEAKK